MSREKGKEGEREAAKEISRLFGVSARRGQQFCGGPGSPDIVCDIPGVHWEVKRAEKQRLYDWLEQAQAECGGSVPVVLHRQNNQPWLAVMKLDDLPALANRLHVTRSEG
ncbi:MAG: hypothetical protein L0Z53_19105 [Acidobacteriales bacterium]|nr:hypothetical protein [Terriglobales bacterium]